MIGILRGFKRQALHAATLGFEHPRSGKRLALESPLPKDFTGLLVALRDDLRNPNGTSLDGRVAHTAMAGAGDGSRSLDPARQAG